MYIQTYKKSFTSLNFFSNAICPALAKISHLSSDIICQSEGIPYFLHGKHDFFRLLIYRSREESCLSRDIN